MDYRKARRDLKLRIQDVERRKLRIPNEVEPSLMGMAVINANWEIDRFNGSLKQLDTDEWMERAKKHHIKVPDERDYWQTMDIDQAEKQTILTDEGKHFISTAIEEKRFKRVGRWIPIIAILISLLSLAISFVALFKR